MKRWTLASTAVLALAVAVCAVLAQQNERGGRGPDDRPPPRGPAERSPTERGPAERGPGRGMRGPINPLMRVLDTDGDGELSAEEIANAPKSLLRLDRDGDGRLSREEMRPPRPADDRDRPRGKGEGDDRRPRGKMDDDDRGPPRRANRDDGEDRRPPRDQMDGDERRPPRGKMDDDDRGPPPRDGDDRRPPRGKEENDDRRPPPREDARQPEAARRPTLGPEGQTVGLMKNTAAACPGYTLFAPKHHTVVYLMDNQGRAVHSWKSEYEPGQSVYLLENGHLLHCCFTHSKGFTRGGEGGRLEEFDWDGNLVWEFEYSSDKYLSHHDIKPLPNGNVLVLAVEKKSHEECLAVGFDPQMLRDEQLFPEHIIEVQPTRPRGGKIVWQWHVWDHLIQDFDRGKANYGEVAAHPELVDVHCNGRATPAFWNHMNSIAYNPQLDQILLSVRGCNEIWIVDHSTTTDEARGHAGGKGGKGGDLLYRWGNPAAYHCGTGRDRRLFQQHDAQWIPAGCPGEGHILIFNNGLDRGYSTIDEIAPPIDSSGHYTVAPGKAFGPGKPVWTYQAANPEDFYSSEISGAHRLPNGNTLICAGVQGEFFEVTPAGKTVWQYVNPVVHNGILAQGELPGKDHRGHSWNAVFKIHRYAPSYAGLAGKDLAPKGPIEQPASMRGKTGFAEQAAEGAPEGGGRRDDRRSDDRRRSGEDRRRPPPRDEDRGGPRDDDRRPPRDDDRRPSTARSDER